MHRHIVLLEQFRDDPATLVALCSIRACGVGTDGMQHVADEALFVEVPDDPSVYAQAQARLYRSGQRGASVSMVYLLATGPKQACNRM